MKGILQEDAPALLEELGRVLPPSKVTRISLAYAISASYGSLKEDLIRRISRSYTPRPARCCRILLAQCHEKRPLLLSAACFACCPSLPPSAGPPPHDSPPSGYVNEIALAERVQAWLKGEPQELEESQVDIERLGLVLLIDELRHAHLTKDPIVAATLLYQRAEKLVLSCRQNQSHQRLMVLIEAWCKRQKRQYSLSTP